MNFKDKIKGALGKLAAKTKNPNAEAVKRTIEKLEAEMKKHYAVAEAEVKRGMELCKKTDDTLVMMLEFMSKGPQVAEAEKIQKLGVILKAIGDDIFKAYKNIERADKQLTDACIQVDKVK